MNEYPTVEALRFDPMPTATMVEMVVGDYLRAPDAGIYFKGSTEPVMFATREYFQQAMVNGVRMGEATPVKNLEDLNRHMPVFGSDGVVVATPNQIPFLDYEPVLPVSGLRVVRKAIEDVVDGYGSAPANKIARPDPIQLYADLLSPLVLQEKQEVAELVIDQITGIVSGIRSQVRNFCGDNRWIMHFLREKYGAFVVQKSIDWRIVEYHRLTGTRYGK